MPDLINTSILIDNRDMFEKGLGHWDAKQLTGLFDLDGSGHVEGVEQDAMESINLIHTLESIPAAVTRAWNDDKFNLDNGSYLTDTQQSDRDRNDFIAILNKGLAGTVSADMKIDQRYDMAPFEQLSSDAHKNLAQDLRERSYLQQSELHTNP